ncbi:MAG: GNAT family N-acetyltransferase [Phototrophicaceae bacterium]|jgi:GNAT superfamily N-acetyltransferase
MQIRPARRGDVGEIAELWAALVDAHQTLDPRLPRPLIDGRERYARMIFDRLDTPTMAAWVAVNHRGLIVGYVLVFIIDLVVEPFIPEQAGLIADLYVQPEVRQQGIGTQLVQASLDWFKKQGIKTVEWEVAAHNHAGRAFWERIGGRALMTRMRLDHSI